MPHAEVETKLALASILCADLDVILRDIPHMYGGHHAGYAELVRGIGEHCKADFEAAVTERVVDEAILSDLGIGGAA